MKILFADKFPDPFGQQILSRGHSCTHQPDLSAEDLPAEIGDHEVLVVRSTRVSAHTIAAGEQLELIIRAGAGTNTIDKDAATARDIAVCNVPGKNAVAVAELTLGLLIAIDRNIPDNVIDLRQGKWDKQRYANTRGLLGRNLGIVGMGAIGMAVAERAKAFGLHLYVIKKPDRAAETAQALEDLGVYYADGLHDLAEACDILSFHVPAAQATRGMVDRALLEKLAPGTILLNTSRGDVVDEQALLAVLDSKGIRAGLDVYRDEPGSGQGAFDSALARHPNVYGTHHIGASTAQAQAAVAGGVVEIIQAFEQGETLHCVNKKA